MTTLGAKRLTTCSRKGREKEVEHLAVFLHVIATQNEIQSFHFLPISS